MKLLYISSGYSRIYDYLDQSMKAELSNNHYEWLHFHPLENIEKLKTIVATFQPQLALTVLGDYLSVPAIQYLKENGIKLACWMTEDPFYIDKTIQIIHRFDYIFTIDTGALKYYQSVHPNTYHLPLGTNDTIFKPVPIENVYKSELLLVGYPYPTRVNFIHFLLEHTKYQITLIGKGWYNRLQKRWRNNSRVMIKDIWIEPQKVTYYYNGASIVLNPHRTHNFWHNQNTRGVMSESMNNRTFDVAACGAFQLIEEKPDLRSFFTEEEMISYLDYEDCLRKVIIYMNNKEMRERIAQKARKIVIEQHTFRHRIKEMIEIIQ
ncbi:glycosyltransferase [Bacillus cereus group sp. BfR-BA-01380]|uniref:CgeB family protein n=1 Tax=Bacillus cereus group sp. BfR-BA-01380 TaxID=2920324 RepID=UPI001F57D4DA|nr:glycosyltransferase [Bacillus cereus group sp. BfR-BA-01380]